MSSGQCRAGDTIGFPQRLSQRLDSTWPATSDAQGQLRKIVVPTDFTIQWGGMQTKSVKIDITHTISANGKPGVFQIRGINTITDATTINYGPASYSCSSVLSIVQNQHKPMSSDTNSLYEVILAFQINNKSINPSSPDIILLCRPLVFTSSASNTPFWSAVDRATTSGAQTTDLNMSSIYGYNMTTPMSMITYQTCMPVRIRGGSGGSSDESLRIRVNVVPQPIYINATESGLGRCSAITKYTLTTEPKRVINLFDNSSGKAFQFQDGLGPGLYPSHTDDNLVPSPSGSVISAFTDVLNKFKIQVPEVFLGKSLSDISSADTPPPAKPRKKAFKCFTINPEKDVVGDQILIDPTTGKSLVDTMSQNSADGAGGAITQSKYYTMSGDDIPVILTVQKTFPVIPNRESGISDLTSFITQDSNKVRIVYASLANPGNVYKSLHYIGDTSVLTSSALVTSTISNLKPAAALTYDAPGTVDITEISVNSLNNTSSGILPGDIEQALTLLLTIVGSVILFAYLGYIAHMIIYRDNGFHDSFYHILIFIVLLVLLVLFGIYVEKPSTN